MRHKLALGLGLTGLLAGSSAAQFGSPAPPANPAPNPPMPAPFGGPTAGTPAVPRAPMTTAVRGAGGYVAPVGGFQPARPTSGANAFRPALPPGAIPVEPVQIEYALGPNHPLAVKPQDGNYFILVKSYSRPHKPGPGEEGYTVKQLSEALAADIQKTHGARVRLFELISDEKRAEAKARTEARQKAARLAAAMEEMRKKSELQGMPFLGFDTPTIKFQTFHYRDQVAVLVGGFPTEDDAVKALAEVKKWPAPTDTRLMDGSSIATRQRDGRIILEKKYIHPYATAMIVQNPTLPREQAMEEPKLEPYVVKLNEGRPYSLLQTTKRWTIAVQRFSAPVRYVSKDSKIPHMSLSKDADILIRGEQQAEALAKALREMKGPPTPAYPGGQPLNLDAYVLHMRNASMVTVGQFDSPNDPELQEKMRILSNLRFNQSRDAQGYKMMGMDQNLFADKLLPVPIPRH